MKPRIYIETSVVSYLTALPARDVTLASHQAFTRDLWDRPGEFEAYISELVITDAHARQFDYDLMAICADLMKRQAQSGHRVVRLAPKPIANKPLAPEPHSSAR